MSSSDLFARKGRDRQRYDNNFRLVSGCIPYRSKENGASDCCDLVDRLEVLMISRPTRDDLVFPKGGWEDDETVNQAACREALEEAGVKGIISETPLGYWEFRSKSNQDSCSTEGACKGYMFALEVTEELEYWPEQTSHGRRWVSVREAYQLCRYEWMRQALDSFKAYLSHGKIAPSSASELPEPSNLCMMMSTSGERAIALC